MEPSIPSLTLPSGRPVPVLGQGTWKMGEEPARRSDEVAALRLGLDLGMALIDTAEMYADGGAEAVVGEVMAGRREHVFLVSKCYPHHAGLTAMARACDASLKRLRTDYLDLYLLHWRESVALSETVEAFDRLAQAGKIRDWGVSNCDIQDMQELLGLPKGGAVSTNQVLYNLSRRGIEFALLPWCRQRHIPIMGYAPMEQGRLLAHPVLKRIGWRHEATPAQVALAWVLRQAGVMVVAKAVRREHVRANRAALDLRLTGEDLAELDRSWPPPRQAGALEML